VEKQRYIRISGEEVPVTEEVYRVFMRPIWREKKRRQREKERGTQPLSLNKFLGAGFDIPSGDALVEEIVADKLLLEMLMNALDELTTEERELIDAIYYDDLSERETARKIGRPKTSIHDQKIRILDKLKKFIENL